MYLYYPPYGCHYVCDGDCDGVCHYKGLSEFRVQTDDDVMQLLELGNRHRTTRSTDYNITSSRSHAILQLTFEIERTDAGQTVISHSKLSLVDLAGSEKMLTTTIIDTDKHVRHNLYIHTCMHHILSARPINTPSQHPLCARFICTISSSSLSLSIHPHTYRYNTHPL